MKGRKLKLSRCPVCGEIVNPSREYPYIDRWCEKCTPSTGGALIDLSGFKESTVVSQQKIEKALKKILDT